MNSLNKLAPGAYLWYTLIAPAPAHIKPTVSRLHTLIAPAPGHIISTVLRLKSCVHLHPRRSITSSGWTAQSQNDEQSFQQPEVDSKLEGLKAEIKALGTRIQDLRASGAPNMELKKQYIELKALNKELEALSLRLRPPDSPFDREKMLQLATRCFYFGPAFEPYRGVAGLYDLGPLGTGLLNNLVREWELLFVRRDAMLQVTAPVLTPEAVLRASGHIDKFADHMVKDTVTGECYRLDHLIKLHLEKKMLAKKTSAEEKEALTLLLARLDGMDVTELGVLVKQHDMKAPATGNALTEPVEFNLMFSVADEQHRLYLRPETAQGIFLNFPRLLQYNRQQLPLVAAQVGPAFRNEVNPQAKLLRMRQFTMAEIEHFCFPDDKTHHKFHEVSGEVLSLLPASAQLAGEPSLSITIGEALAMGLVDNETLGYYMARIQQYLHRIGIRPTKLRFRQHLGNEMAHYACDCWDAECLTSYGWIECVGCADRSAYDLSCHAKATGVRFTVDRILPVPKEIDAFVFMPNKKLISTSFSHNLAKKVVAALAELTSEQVQSIYVILQSKGQVTLPDTSYIITPDMILGVERVKKQVNVEQVTPSVVEPSFGLERILYSLLEQCFCVREEDGNRMYFALLPEVAPIKVAVIPLSVRHKEQAAPIVKQIVSELLDLNVAVEVEESTGSIGRRYTHCDQRSIPYAVTIDFDTLSESPATVTLRERDTMQQIRIPVSEVAEAIQQLVTGRVQWTAVTSLWPAFTQQQKKIM